MKHFEALLKKEIFPGSDIVLRFIFKTMDAGADCALLSVENHQLSFNPAILREQSVLFCNMHKIVLNACHHILRNLNTQILCVR